MLIEHPLFGQISVKCYQTLKNEYNRIPAITNIVEGKTSMKVSKIQIRMRVAVDRKVQGEFRE